MSNTFPEIKVHFQVIDHGRYLYFSKFIGEKEYFTSKVGIDNECVGYTGNADLAVYIECLLETIKRGPLSENK